MLMLQSLPDGMWKLAQLRQAGAKAPVRPVGKPALSG
jgi:hypothetical protein